MPKGSNRPKRALGAYNFFVRDRRQYYKDKNVSINFTDFSKECSELWKGRGRPSTRTTWTLTRYGSRTRWLATRRSPKSRKRKSNQPKRPLSGFFLFCQQVRPKFRMKTRKRRLEIWRRRAPHGESEEEKAPYEYGNKKRYRRIWRRTGG